MIVTEGGKNIYPEDVETVFDGLPVKEYCVFAANYIWPRKSWGRDALAGAAMEQGQQFSDALGNEISARNLRLADYKRVGGYLVWERDFPADGIDEDQAGRVGGGDWTRGCAGGCGGDLGDTSLCCSACEKQVLRFAQDDNPK